MKFLYCVSRHLKGEYQPISVHGGFESAIVSIYDVVIKNYKKSIGEIGIHQSIRYKDDLHELNELRHHDTPPSVAFLFRGKFKITTVENLITSEVALKNTIAHIDERFLQLHGEERNICFPKNIISDDIEEGWYKIDKYNDKSVTTCIEKHIQHKIEELKVHKHVAFGFLTKHTADFLVVRFTHSQDFLFSENSFDIVISPLAGFKESLNH